MHSKKHSTGNSKSISRRDFVRYSALAAGGVTLAGCSGAGPSAPSTAGGPSARPRVISSPNEKLNIAVIGFGGKGASDAVFCSGENIVALCDADQNIGAATRAKFPKANFYQDFRVMLEKEKTIDAVNIAVPDHLHAYIASTAIKMGKHVYLQKPLTHSVYEARLLRKLAAEYGVATQMGNQGTAENGLRRGVEVIQSGIIGNVRDVYVWSNRPIWPQGIERPSESDAIPGGLDWDLWLGPAPLRPYKGMYNGNQAYHPFNWRGWMDFGTGSLGDMACHTANLPFRGLKLGYPTEIVAETVELTQDCYPIQSKIRFEFPAREGLVPVSFHWYDGGVRLPGATKKPYHDGSNKPPKEVLTDVVAMLEKPPGSGCLLVGDKGQIFSPDDYGTRFSLKLSDDKEFRDGPTHPAVAGIPQTLPRNEFLVTKKEDGTDKKNDSDTAHHLEWIHACKGGKPGYSNFDIAAYITEIILLGCVAIRAGKKLEWDGPNMMANNAPEASQYVHPAFRKGWEI